MDFQEYCIKKKIDPNAFKANEPVRWEEFNTIFEQVHPESFTQQKKFLINDIRRKYPLAQVIEQAQATSADSAPAVKKPAIKIGPVIKK